MVKATITDEMKAALSEIKGKTFKSYEYAVKDRYVACQVMRLNFGRKAIDLYNEQIQVPFFGGTEDLPFFVLKEAQLKSEFPYGVKTKAYMINEKIKSVEIINDEININKGEYEISIDQAIIIRTEYNVYSFYKDWMFSEFINISADKENYMAYDIEKVREEWSDDGENTVEIIRTVIEL